LKSLLTYKKKTTKIGTTDEVVLKEKNSQEENPNQDANASKNLKM